VEERLGTTTLKGPRISTSETREVRTSVIASAPWPYPRILGCLAGSQAPRPVMVREAKSTTLFMFILELRIQAYMLAFSIAFRPIVHA